MAFARVPPAVGSVVRQWCGVRVEEHVPLVEPTHDAGRPRHTFPDRPGRVMPGAVEERNRREEREERVRRKPSSGKASSRRSAPPSTDSSSARTVAPLCAMPARSRCSCSNRAVRIRTRVQDRHPFERCAGPHRIDDAAHDRTHFVVGIGRRDHVRADGDVDVDAFVRWRGGGRTDDAGDAREHLGVGARITGTPGDHRHRHRRSGGA